MGGQDEAAPSDVNSYLALIALTLLYYDYLLTLHLESARFWKYSAFSWVSTLFYLNRYFPLVIHVPVAMEYFWTATLPNKVAMYAGLYCHKLQTVHQYAEMVIQIIAAVILVIRTWALFGRPKWVIGILVCIMLAGIAVGLWSLLHGNDASTLDINNTMFSIGCAAFVSQSSGKQLAITWSGAFFLDLVVFSMTLYKSVSIIREFPGTWVMLDVFLRDGAVYFLAMTLANGANIVTFLVGDVSTRGCLTTFTNVISSVLISRLMFNLRDPALAHKTDEWTSPMSVTPDLTAISEYSGETLTEHRDGAEDIEMNNYAYANRPSKDSRQTKAMFTSI
ncbi:hypothetical protein DL96DRAFT_1708448 [Flagelloscypha sp. PMI_526]|nr:hypothetical protein DL96DRAFT_1708448 [Flagelloscypha sp. PMI_526]